MMWWSVVRSRITPYIGVSVISIVEIFTVIYINVDIGIASRSVIIVAWSVNIMVGAVGIVSGTVSCVFYVGCWSICRHVGSCCCGPIYSRLCSSRPCGWLLYRFGSAGEIPGCGFGMTSINGGARCGRSGYLGFCASVRSCPWHGPASTCRAVVQSLGQYIARKAKCQK